MKRTGNFRLGATTLAAVLVAPTALSTFGQVIVDEQFNYANQTELAANWTIGVNSPLTLDPVTGTVSNPGGGTNPNIWSGSTFTLDPSDASPIRLTGDIISDGAAGSVTTIGLRTGTNPLFEMGLYRLFDNIQTDADSSAPIDPVQSGIGVRTINIGTDLNLQDWVKMGEYYTGSARFEATFTEMSVTTRIDLGIDGDWDFSYTETGTTPMGNFTELRIHAPTPTLTGTTGAIVDNIRIEIVPEPSTYALLALGGMAFAALRRRRS